MNLRMEVTPASYTPAHEFFAAVYNPSGPGGFTKFIAGNNESYHKNAACIVADCARLFKQPLWLLLLLYALARIGDLEALSPAVKSESAK